MSAHKFVILIGRTLYTYDNYDDIPLEFADLDEILAWCRKEFIDYATCMRYEVYNNRAKFIFYDNQDYVSFLLRWA
jgi:hypothetical protein